MHLQTLVIINSALILFSNNMHETQLYIDKDTFTGTYLNILDLQNKMRYRRPHILQNVNRSREVLLHKPEDRSSDGLRLLLHTLDKSVANLVAPGVVLIIVTREALAAEKG